MVAEADDDISYLLPRWITPRNHSDSVMPPRYQIWDSSVILPTPRCSRNGFELDFDSNPARREINRRRRRRGTRCEREEIGDFPASRGTKPILYHAIQLRDGSGQSTNATAPAHCLDVLGFSPIQHGPDSRKEKACATLFFLKKDFFANKKNRGTSSSRLAPASSSGQSFSGAGARSSSSCLAPASSSYASASSP
jgi:hypothetical protein